MDSSPRDSFGDSRTSVNDSRTSVNRYRNSPMKMPRKFAKRVAKLQPKVGKSPLHCASQFDIYKEYNDIRKTSIICTIGPKTKSVESLRRLVDAGMNVVRLNFSHGSHEYHLGVIKNLNIVRNQDGVPPIALALDTKGPEVRTGLVSGGGELSFNVDDKLTLTTDIAFHDKCDQQTIYVDYVNLPKKVKLGDLIFIDDGLLSLEVISIAGDFTSVKVKVLNAATISSRKGVNLPNIEVDLPPLSKKDESDIKFGLENGIDMVFASFIRKAEDVRTIRKRLGKKGKHVYIISKIENHEGVQKFDEILKESDGIMVARGDLGIEIPPQKVFLAQKMMIAKCNILGKPIIVATQMLDSMTYNPRPTRAEVSDVANAVLDGADCVMLSGETAKGDYPCETVQMMEAICLSAESAFHNESFYRQCLDLQPNGMPSSVMENICASSVSASMVPGVTAIITTSLHGTSPRFLSKYRPQVPIIVATTNPFVSRSCFLSRGCFPFLYSKVYDQIEDFSDYVNELVKECLTFCHQSKYIKPADKVVLVHGWRAGQGSTNTMRIVTFNV